MTNSTAAATTTSPEKRGTTRSRAARARTRSPAVRATTYSWCNAETTTFFGQEDAELFDVTGGVNGIMDFEPGVDRIDATLGAGQTLESIATQHGSHLLLDFGDGGGEVWLAWTSLADWQGATCSLGELLSNVSVAARID